MSNGGVLNHMRGAHGYFLEFREKRLNVNAKSDNFQEKVCGINGLKKSKPMILKLETTSATDHVVIANAPVPLRSQRLDDEGSKGGCSSPQLRHLSNDEEVN